MRREADREGLSRAYQAMQEATEDTGATLLSEMAKYLDLSEVARYLEQMSSEESEDLWSELDSLSGHKLAA